MSKINPKPKKLTLDKALCATRQPLARLGELVHVQVHNELINQPGFSNGEMRSIFAPSAINRDGSFQGEFHQPVTEQHLRELYNAGGWIESLEDFSDEALALYFNYLGGMWNSNMFAGDVGDPSRFENDCQTDFDQKVARNPNPEARLKLAQDIRESILGQHKKYILAATMGNQYAEQQTSFAGNAHQEQHEIHDQWRNWQSEEAKNNAKFAKQSKQAQAKLLAHKYSIKEKPGTIAKRLEPLSSGTQKK